MIRKGMTLRFLGIGLMLALGLSPAAHAFFPLGGYDPFQQLRLMRWPVDEIDTNNDGDVTQGEGIELFVEGGPRGFTSDEIQAIRDAIVVWEDVPTSFIAFQIKAIFQDPIFLTGSDLGDAISTVQMNVAVGDGEGSIPDPTEIFIPEVTFPILGVTITLFTPIDIVLESATTGTSQFVSAGTILDADILIDATSHRNFLGLQPLVELKATMVHELGHFLGLGHTPLNNLRDDLITTNVVENDLFWLTGADGQQRRIGVTPTMFPFAFAVRDSITGQVRDGQADLAPDDISAVSFMYPRQGQAAKFFNLKQEVRSQVRPDSGLPSQPILGSHVVAWADTDNDPNTPHIPMFSTITGLYEFAAFEELEGRFEIINLWKQFEMPNNQATIFSPSYIFTQNPLNGTGFERQAPPIVGVSEFDSLQGPASFSVLTRSEDEYINVIFSEVFNEFGNLIDISNREGGTHFAWDFERNVFASLESGRTLPAILGSGDPMFGDPNEVCPFNFISNDIGGGDGGGIIPPTDGGGEGTKFAGLTGPDKLRNIRDNFLLQSGLGTAAVKAWYQAAPQVTQYLMGHTWALAAFKGGVAIMYFMLAHLNWVLAALVGLGLLLARRIASPRKAKAAATLGLLLAVFMLALPAQARVLYLKANDFVEGSSAIVVANVDAIEAHSAASRGIYTEVLLTITDVIKGEVNTDSPLSFSVTGGTLNGLVQSASELPTFKEGEEVILHLLQDESGNFIVFGGVLGKSVVLTNPTNGQKYVQGAYTKAYHAEKRAKSGEADTTQTDTETAPLGEYVSYLKDIVREQKKNPVKTAPAPAEDFHEVHNH